MSTEAVGGASATGLSEQLTEASITKSLEIKLDMVPSETERKEANKIQ